MVFYLALTISGELQFGGPEASKTVVLNPSDPYAVAMTHGGVIVGYVPRNISVCSAFLRRGGIMTCVVAGVRQYSSDLLQGGLEVPCKLTVPSMHLLKTSRSYASCYQLTNRGVLWIPVLL